MHVFKSDVNCKLAGTVAVNILKYIFLSNPFCKANKLHGNTDCFKIQAQCYFSCNISECVFNIFPLHKNNIFFSRRHSQKDISFIFVKRPLVCARNHSARVHFRLLRLFVEYILTSCSEAA